MFPSKIVTHSGTFHADEISAIALLLHLFPGTPVERTYTPTEQDFGDPSVFVLDIGRRYQPELNNYDHHQDASLPAANMLVLRNFLAPQKPRLAELLEKHFFSYISRVDVGEIVENPNTPPTISGIIRACNNLPEDIAFDTALSIVSQALHAQMATALRRIESETLWLSVKQFGTVAVWDDPRHIAGWHELAEESGVNFLVTPNARGGYQITSRDSKQFPIPADPRQTFRHNSGFLAAYATLQDAYNHALEISATI